MKILVLAGGADQIALIRELQSRGHEVLLLDYLDNPVAKPLVNKHIKESTLDIERVKECVISEKIDLICTACTDQALLTVAKVSEELNLPCYLSYDKALFVTNKSFMKERFYEYGVPTAKYIKYDSTTKSAELNKLTYPLVIKPADCNSSKGVVKVFNEEELKLALQKALSLSRTSTAIIEEFKVGREISVDIYIENGVPILLSATETQKILGKNGFTIIGSLYPILSSEQEEQILDIANKIIEAFKITNSPLIIQLIHSGNQFFVIEFSARMGGGSKYKLIQEISGVNIMSKYVDLILGNKPSIIPNKRKDIIQMIYIYSDPGRVCEIKGLEKLISEKHIKEYFIYKSLGTIIERAETSSDRVLGMIVVASTEIDLKHKIKNINNTLSIIDEFGNDIMMHSLLV